MAQISQGLGRRHARPAHRLHGPQLGAQRPRLQPARGPGGLPLLRPVAEPRPERELPAPGRVRADPPRHRPGELRNRPDRGQRAALRAVSAHALPAHRAAPAHQHPGVQLMGQRAPTVGQIAVAVAFAFSCFGLLLFLWATFGGPVPLKPEGYRIKVPFSEATQLAQESDVRIHNVSVGKVKSIDAGRLGPEQGPGGRHPRDRHPVRADPRRHPGDAAAEDAARRDLRRAHAGRPKRAEAPGGRNLAQGAGTAVGPARRDLQDLRRQDPGRVPDLDAAARDCELRARGRPLGRDRQPRALRRGRQQGCCACSTPSRARSSSSCATPARSSAPSASARASSRA